tara:strand:- start:338 stop:883 length:546 start_codon:yes stop_codon:yes gene_type:complete
MFDFDYFGRRMKQREAKGGIARLDVYEDSEGYKTVGWGHKVTPADNLELGDQISMDRAIEFFEKDLSAALSITNDAPWIVNLPAPKRFVMHDMAFNMGYAKLKGTVPKGFKNFFHNMKMYSQYRTGHLKKYYSERAAAEMKMVDPFGGDRSTTRYWNQTGTRAKENYKYILDDSIPLMEYP